MYSMFKRAAMLAALVIVCAFAVVPALANDTLAGSTKQELKNKQEADYRRFVGCCRFVAFTALLVAIIGLRTKR
jgi:hypothetical protein